MTWGQIRLALVAFVKSNNGGTLPFHVYNNAIDSAYGKVLSARRWRKLNVDGTLAVLAPVTAGTVSISQGGTLVTLAGSTWPMAVSGRKFRITGQQVWYVIAWATATTATLDRPFEDEAVTGGTYQIFQDEYELPEDCNAVKTFTDIRTGYPLIKKDPDWITQNNPSLMRTGDPEVWAPTTSTSQSDVKRVQFYPVPLRALSLKIRYRQIVTGFDGSNDGDSPLAWISTNAIELDSKATISREHLKNPAMADQIGREYKEALQDMHREEMQEGSVVPLRMDPHYTRRSL